MKFPVLSWGIPPHPPSTYRPDIDGLRAIAVGAVIGFHAWPQTISGGYVGVDIFFVISGYLISSIILRSLAKTGDVGTPHSPNSFRFIDFYANRIKRIFPALLVVMLSVVLAGWLFLLQGEFVKLGQHIYAGAFFYSNWVLLSEVGYFDSQADLKPLLHLWSLAIEEQFYIVWPWLLYALLAWRRAMLPLLLGLFIASFAANLWQVSTYRMAAFYMPHTRFWELLLGSILAYTSNAGQYTLGDMLAPTLKLIHHQNIPWCGLLNNLSSIFGTLLLGIAIATFDNHLAFPGWWALLPTMGALLLLAAGPTAYINRLILAQPALVFLGLISYPLYLWHWPLLAYARILQTGTLTNSGTVILTNAQIVTIIASSLLLAWLTYRYIESPIRFGKSRCGDTPHPNSKIPPFAALGDVRDAPAPTSPTWHIKTWLIGPAASDCILCKYQTGLTAAMVLLAILGLAIQAGLLEERLSKFRYLTQATKDWQHVTTAKLTGSSVTDQVMVLGDSYAIQYFPRLQALVKGLRDVGPTPTPLNANSVRGVVFRAFPNCAPIPGIERKSFSCHTNVSAAYARAAANDISIVVIVGSWLGFKERGDYYAITDPTKTSLDVLAPTNEWIYELLRDAIINLRNNGKTVYLLLSHPGGNQADPYAQVDRWYMQVRPLQGIAKAEYLQQRQAIDSKLHKFLDDSGVTIIDPVDWLCDRLLCPTVSAQGDPYYMDKTHLRASYVRARVQFLDFIITKPIGSIAPKPASGNGGVSYINSTLATVWGTPPSPPSEMWGTPPSPPSEMWGTPPSPPSDMWGTPPSPPSEMWRTPPTTSTGDASWQLPSL